MNRQMTFTDFEYASRKRTTRREEFLKTMESIIPWKEWAALIEPHYPSGKRGCPPRGIAIMLRMYFLQIWFNLSDEMVEDSIYDSYAMRSFLGIDFGDAQAPDAATLLKFRHLLARHDLPKKLFDDLSPRLESHGCMMRGGTIVDATIIRAASSTKNAKGERDPEMHQMKKGNEYDFGMKGHIGVDAGSGYIHTVTATAGNAHDITKVEHPFHLVKSVFGYSKAVYRGISKNLNRLYNAFRERQFMDVRSLRRLPLLGRDRPQCVLMTADGEKTGP